jgi:hypothetical protein
MKRNRPAPRQRHASLVLRTFLPFPHRERKTIRIHQFVCRGKLFEALSPLAETWGQVDGWMDVEWSGSGSDLPVTFWPLTCGTM